MSPEVTSSLIRSPSVTLMIFGLASNKRAAIIIWRIFDESLDGVAEPTMQKGGILLVQTLAISLEELR